MGNFRPSLRDSISKRVVARGHFRLRGIGEALPLDEGFSAARENMPDTKRGFWQSSRV
jgi:hypothetical protein